jgi:hypothetical protein
VDAGLQLNLLLEYHKYHTTQTQRHAPCNAPRQQEIPISCPPSLPESSARIFELGYLVGAEHADCPGQPRDPCKWLNYSCVPHHEVVSFDIGMASGLDLGSNVANDVLKLVEKAPTIGTNELRRKEKNLTSV